VHSIVPNKWAKFGAKIFRHYWDIAIFVLGYFILPHPVQCKASVNSHSHSAAAGNDWYRFCNSQMDFRRQHYISVLILIACSYHKWVFNMTVSSCAHDTCIKLWLFRCLWQMRFTSIFINRPSFSSVRLSIVDRELCRQSHSRNI